MEVIDLELVINLARKHNVLVVVDNTFSTPYLQRPIELGADVVVHSATKYLSGHGDVIAGLAAGKKRINGANCSNHAKGYWRCAVTIRRLAGYSRVKDITASNG